ncbi:MAG: UDP-N-acetylglucosamine--N-acetylmuramyl-(pentapeptide) pyrophosphoryl-undecaprenol N-acetylglucosamine transferase [Chloroflexi bacterium]|nr:UDP-N-acetylglucosamine--N-acetylmuramyl-(pentapeptide) pyrophosphoryl-undecaprenol N-acetylglucosamine transferase [Chloroflexota bacterium]
MRVLISGGGTGGHVYPALAVIAQLPRATELAQCGSAKEASLAAPQPLGALAVAAGHLMNNRAVNASPVVELLWVGSNDGMEQALVEHAGIPYQGIDTGKVRGVNPLTALMSGVKMVAGVRQTLAILRKFQPDVCFVTGGYVCTPVAIACRLQRVPVLIYLPDMLPGWAIRLLSRLAQRVAVSFPEVATYFGGEAPQGKAVVTGYPVRSELVEAAGGGRLDAQAQAHNRATVRTELAERLQRPLAAPDQAGRTLPLVLVWGGSQGSRNINQSTWQALPQLLTQAHILHVIGNRDWSLMQEWLQQHPLTPEQAGHYHPVDYLHEEMVLALVAADVSVARAGASSLGEFPVARLPSVLVPLLGVNQLQNALLLEEHGAAVIIADAVLTEQLASRLLALLQDQTQRLAMENALANLAQPDAALKIAQELCQLADGRQA